ncbi:hypothetical protein TanjilG_00131 [Lupinus angustifolius]|uniref:Uncharacterized protein n=1 Tax=Lupinus angustifolius TaxID=3871 RepID=A0A1J7FPT2_LUPAN|nr:hypothetical protein TanjilG_00131 [Lupinus angustifolius]
MCSMSRWVMKNENEVRSIPMVNGEVALLLVVVALEVRVVYFIRSGAAVVESYLGMRLNEIAEVLTRRNYFNTFGRNPVCTAAGLAVPKVIEKEKLQENAFEVF